MLISISFFILVQLPRLIKARRVKTVSPAAFQVFQQLPPLKQCQSYILFGDLFFATKSTENGNVEYRYQILGTSTDSNVNGNHCHKGLSFSQMTCSSSFFNIWTHLGAYMSSVYHPKIREFYWSFQKYCKIFFSIHRSLYYTGFSTVFYFQVQFLNFNAM